jgi:hypothetical protein
VNLIREGVECFWRAVSMDCQSTWSNSLLFQAVSPKILFSRAVFVTDARTVDARDDRITLPLILTDILCSGRH